LDLPTPGQSRPVSCTLGARVSGVISPRFPLSRGLSVLIYIPTSPFPVTITGMLCRLAKYFAVLKSFLLAVVRTTTAAQGHPAQRLGLIQASVCLVPLFLRCAVNLPCWSGSDQQSAAHKRTTAQRLATSPTCGHEIFEASGDFMYSPATSLSFWENSQRREECSLPFSLWLKASIQRIIIFSQFPC